MSDNDQETTPIGLFHFAHSYWRSAVALEKAEVKVMHPGSPIWFLYFHAIELYLKAFLRLHGTSVEDLSHKYRHHTRKLADAVKVLGFHFDDEDEEIVSLMAGMDLTDVRYIKTGCFTRPTHEALHRTCKSFHQTVERALRERDHPVRRYETGDCA
jgi:hypothetical protein